MECKGKKNIMRFYLIFWFHYHTFKAPLLIITKEVDNNNADDEMKHE